MTTAERRMRRLRGYLDAWVANPANDRRDEWMRLVAAGAHGDERARRVGVTQLAYLANWHAQTGAHAVLRGDASGWEGIALSLQYRLRHAGADPSMVPPAELALLVAHCVAVGLDDRAAPLLERLRELRDHSPEWRFSRLAPLMLELRAGAPAHPLSDAPDAAANALHMVAFGPVDDLATAVPRVCDEHLQQALSQEGYADFALSPYELLPIELYALALSRRSRDLESVWPAHPLLRSPLWVETLPHPPVELPDAVLALLDAAGAHAERSRS